MEPEKLRPDPKESAAAAGLHYVTDEMPGIRRKRWGRGFTYVGPDGDHITDPEERARIDRLAIPPAWTEVWISPDPDAHLLATGRDERGRKQYRYHPRWREIRDESKFDRMLAFGESLPAVRKRVEQDLRRRGLPREKVLAIVVRLLETTHIRIGNAEYARDNQSFGLTTLRDRHAVIEGSKIRFEFRGKSGKDRVTEIRDRRLTRIVKACRDVPGYELFQYIDDEGQHQDIDSTDVNEYLRTITGQPFTAKDFRTWAGTLMAMLALHACGPCTSEKEVNKNIVRAVDHVADRLGNTRAICRQYYIHPRIMEAYQDRSIFDLIEEEIEEIDGLDPEEYTLISVLRRLTVVPV